MKLYLLKSDLQKDQCDVKTSYYCPDCETVKGLFSYYPDLDKHIAVQFVDYEKPRLELIERLGEENQECPVLVFDDNTFINTANELINFLHKKFNTATPLP